jgi:hypothetical protein
MTPRTITDERRQSVMSVARILQIAEKNSTETYANDVFCPDGDRSEEMGGIASASSWTKTSPRAT